MDLIDTHAHLDMREFDSDREEVISMAIQAGVRRFITVGIDLESSRKAVALAQSHKEIYATIGIHPNDSAWFTKADFDKLAPLVKHPGVVAVGETGLDFYRERAPKEAQYRVLRWQLDLAQQAGLPVVIHSRKADNEMINVLQQWTQSLKLPAERQVGVIHCFNSDRSTAFKYLDMGFNIAFGAYIGYPTAHLQDVVASIPLGSYLVETDCPFLPPQVHRGKRNEPSYIPLTVQVLAGMRKISAEAVARETTANAVRLFNLKEK